MSKSCALYIPCSFISHNASARAVDVKMSDVLMVSFVCLSSCHADTHATHLTEISNGYDRPICRALLSSECPVEPLYQNTKDGCVFAYRGS